MILIEQSVGATHLPPSSDMQRTSEGNTTLIILERDGTISHCSPDIPDDQHRRARVSLVAKSDSGQPESSVIDRILSFTFDVLGISNLEVQVYEHQKR
ncbi:hypothetical protein EKD04_020380 [Chloroflexales bacterium ZM16-3]|nr:hypothetical protein [Chloroflexales bacterium ZM16-3]